MILLSLLFLLATGVRSCKEVSTDCHQSFDDTKFKVNQVAADINETLKESSEFFTKFEANLHKFKDEIESGLKAEERLLDELLKEHHSNQLHKNHSVGENCNEVVNKTTVDPSPSTRVTTPSTKISTPAAKVTTPGTTVTTSQLRPEPDSEKCKAKLIKNGQSCENCTSPIYDDVNMIYTCTKGFAFEIETESRQIRCDFSGPGLMLVHERNEMSGLYNGSLECFPLPPEVTNRHNCLATCAETAACNNKIKLECACLKGYTDVSSKFKKSPGSICTKCNNSESQGTDFVMLYDVSGSISKESDMKMINFVSLLLDFIEIDKSDNRFAFIEFGIFGELRFPLMPKTSSANIIESLKSKKSSYAGGGTNTPDALKIANDEVYAKLPETTRPRVTILFTDGAPTGSYSYYDNLTEARKQASMLKVGNLMGKKSYADLARLMIEDLQREARKMRDIYKARIFTVYVGRRTDRHNVGLMREITSEDEEISVDNFDDLKNDILDKLQTKFC